jgi:ABC-type glycerol-3-phosphate transport system permease component
VTFRRLVVYSAAVLIAAWVVFPLVLVTLAAFTPREGLYAWPRPIWPARFTLATMRTFLGAADVLQSTWNSLAVAGMTIGLAVRYPGRCRARAHGHGCAVRDDDGDGHLHRHLV